jgi:hypothetical protein
MGVAITGGILLAMCIVPVIILQISNKKKK